MEVSARANVNELSAHTKFHYSEAELLHLWAADEPQPVTAILKRFTAQNFSALKGVHMPRDADALLMIDDVKLRKALF